MSVQATPIAFYDQPHQFLPLMPAGHHLDELGRMARPVVEASLRLQAATNEETRSQLRELTRAMNSYYSNRIEGQSTHPVHIAQALRKDFSDKPDVAKRQRLALAHIEAEAELEALLAHAAAHPSVRQQHPDAGDAAHAVAFQSEMLVKAHDLLYSRLSQDDRVSEAGLVIVPGQLRQQDVAVQRHQPPIAHAVPRFLRAADDAYAKPWALESFLVAAACQHHRMLWVHPFIDGNGRACRLQLHGAMHHLTRGLWSVNRGLARRQDEYYVRLSEADMPRHGDLDGRGNLSERMLVEWCRFFIGVCKDQVDFMTQVLDLARIKEHIAALIVFRAQTAKELRPNASDYRKELILPLQHVMIAGPVSRGDFVQMTGLGERTGRKALKAMLDDGLLQSDSPKGQVRIGFPLDALSMLFPRLYPEAGAVVLD